MIYGLYLDREIEIGDDDDLNWQEKCSAPPSTLKQKGDLGLQSKKKKPDSDTTFLRKNFMAGKGKPKSDNERKTKQWENNN